MKHRVLTLLALLAFLSTIPATNGHTVQQPSATPEPQQGGPGADPILQLNLTPEQREQIRSIRQANKEERATINQRLREANQAMEEALDSDKPDESAIEQRLRDLGAAQAAAMRMRILTEVRIRRVLTVEQLGILRTLRLQARQLERARFRNERQQQRRQALDGGRGTQNQPGQLLRPRDLRKPRP
ncbi:MAG TPA: periplasmic heavy metal sensor [Pyrinomonadaceae bacterium]|jgi:Spy/CpxP family protein refolding chaperone|nr:periplasmic heavy metal sensor [Pyrinomonadaceae bacterium]